MIKKILFIGDLNEYGRTLQRYKTLVDLGYELKGVSTVLVPWHPTKDFNLLEAVSWKFKLPVDLTGTNKKIKQIVKDNFDLVWIEKGLTIWPSTLKFIKKNYPEIKLISVSEDDMYAKHNRSLYYTWGLPYYDVIFTTKIYNLVELKSLGAKRTELFLDAYDEKLHRPYILSEEEKKRFSCDVGVIGAFEEDRANKMLFLAENGIKVVVWGNGWGHWVEKHSNLIVKNEHLFKEDYSKAICATKINLCFLRKINRDEVTSRSVEIPACGGFMLAERTKRHLDFFKEDKEAVFFDTDEEMLKKVKYYFAHGEERERIAQAGRERCLRSGYSHRKQLTKMFKIFDDSFNNVFNN